MASLAISSDLLTGFSRLEKRTQARVIELVSKFKQMTVQELGQAAGINLERHNAQRDPRARTVRIDNNHRGVVCDIGNNHLYVLTFIGTHDETDRWMQNNVFKVNPATGAFEIINSSEIESFLERTADQTAAAPTDSQLYLHRRDRDFVQLGIADELLPTLRAFTSEDQLSGLLTILPSAQAEALILLTGSESVDEVYAQVAGSIQPDEIDTEDLATALTSLASRSTFRIVDSEDELAEMLARPLAQWRIYLHHTQEDAAYRPRYNGPARVTGGPGTGKTVVALHRAKHLAERYRATGYNSAKPILVTTFTRNLAESLAADLHLLGGTDLTDLTDVLNVDRLAYRIVQGHEGSRPRIATDSDVNDLLQDVVADLDLPFKAQFLRQEWEHVVLAGAIRSREEYFAAQRVGRGVRLDRRQRATVWRAIEEFERHLSSQGLRTHLQMAAAAAGYLQSRSVLPYRHVIVDEAQDLHEAQWRLLRAIVEPDADDMFIVGDSHQRIYDRRSSLSRVGINIVGRSRRLRINYRTTHEILAWSLSLLGNGTFDDLDVGTETHDFAGYHSFMHGAPPALSGNRSPKLQMDALVQQIKTWVDAGVSEEQIGVTFRTSQSEDRVKRALDGAGIPYCTLGRSQPTSPGVRIGTMFRFKGLEFHCVAVVDADVETIPLLWDMTPAVVDESQHRSDMQRERCLLYVACTRARAELWLGWTGEPSPFIEALIPEAEGIAPPLATFIDPAEPKQQFE